MRSLIAATFTVTVLGTALFPATGQAQGQAVSPRCAFVLVIGRQMCYRPQQASEAERLVPWHVSPTRAVRQTLGIKLSQVSVDSMPASGNTDWHPAEIDYLYGPLRHDYGRQGPSPVAILIRETEGRMSAGSFTPRYTHTVCGQKVEISPAAVDHPYRPYGPWALTANFPHGSRSFTVVANTSQSKLKAFACRMLRGA